MATRERKVPLRRPQLAPSRCVFLLVLVGIAQAIFATSLVFRLQDVSVTGNVRLRDDVIKAEAKLPMRAHLFMLDLKGAEERVRRLHWVKDAAVRRYVPGQVVIRVTERKPTVAVGTGSVTYPSGWFVVSDDGMVLAAAGGKGDDRLPRVTVERQLTVGRRLDPRLVAAVLKLRANMPGDLAADVLEVRAAANGQLDLRVRIAGRPVEVRMGGSEKTRYKFQVLQALMDRLRQEGKPVAYIDLRYSDPAVGHLGPVAPPAPDQD